MTSPSTDTGDNMGEPGGSSTGAAWAAEAPIIDNGIARGTITGRS
jgi:hypothetical protein